MLLDGDSTHCFVQTHIAHFLNFSIESIPQFSILVGSGELLPCSRLAKNVELVIQGHLITVDFYVLPLQDWDMVLGVSWLAKLGPVVTDYSTSVFEFTLKGIRVTWQGDATMTQPIQFNGLRRLVASDSIDHMHHLTLVSPTSSPPAYPDDLQATLKRFNGVFTTPQGLPPTRLQDHHIDLLPDSPLVLV